MEQEQNPLLPEKRGVRNLLIGVGGLSALLGLTVMIGWHTHNLRLVQSTSTSAIMSYNTALSFLLCGVGLIAFALSSLRVVVICGTFVGAVGLLTLSEYCFGLHLGIDQLFMPDYLQSFFSAHLGRGRMSASTALCFTLAGVAQCVIGWSAELKFRLPLVGIIGSILLALGMMSQVRYWAGLVIVSEEGWHSLIRPMAFHTAAGFVVLGFGFFVLAWSESRRKAGGMPHWLPASIFVAVSAGTVFFWQALLEEAYMAQTSSSIKPASLLLPTVILLGGSCLAGLLAVAIALAQKERHKTNLLNEINHVLTREIAQHRQTAEALRKQTDIHHAIFACMSEGVMVADAQGKLLVMNRAAENTLGFRLADAPVDAPETDWAWRANIYLPDQQTPFPLEHLPLVRTLRGEAVNDCEQFILRPGASEGVWCSVNARPLRDAEGRLCGGITVGRNITERKRTDEALQKQTEILHSILNNMADGVIVAAAEKPLLFNPAAERIFGQGVTDTKSDTWSQQYNLYLPDMKTPFPNEELPIIQAIRGTAVDKVEVFVRHADTSKSIWTEVSGRPLKDQNGVIKGGVVVCRDITDRKQTEAALRESEERWHLALRGANDGLWDWNLKTNEVFFSQQWKAILGFEEHEIANHSDEWANRVHPEDIGWVTQTLQDHFAQKTPFYLAEYRMLCKDGSYKWILARGQALWDAAGTAVRIVGSQTDITERKHTEAALRESEERFRSLCAASPMGIFLADEKGKVSYTNLRWQETTGLTLEETLGEGSLQGVHHEDRQGMFAEWQASIAAGREFAKELRFVRPTGEVRWVYVQAALIRTEDGTVREYVGGAIDITERKAVDRMKDEFVSVVSHELRTPLTSIRGSLGLLASGRLGHLQEKGQRMLDIAVTNTDRLVRLINDILDIERIQSGTIAMQKQECNAADLMTQATEVMRAMAEKAEVTLSVAPYSTRLWADPDRILQTLTNLLSNAIKFSPRGTTVWLTAEPQDGHLRFAVKDQGRGIPGDKLDSIFERFQQVNASDSRDKGGTGLGLAICRSIVQQHDGRIGVESTLGVGSSFYIILPALTSVEMTALEGSPSVLTPPLNGRSKTACVLVAEDDADLAKVLVLMLQRHGIESFYVQTGREAIQLSPRLSPDLLILDLGMPDGDGFMVVNWLRQQNSLRHIPLIVYSAKDLDADERERLKLGPTQFFTKGRITLDEFEQRVIEFLTPIFAQRGEGEHNGTQADFAH